MKLTAGNIFEAVPVITAIINEKRPMPGAGKFRLARMHAKLLPEFNVISGQRDDLIKAYDHHPMVPLNPSEENPMGEGLVPSENFTVPADKMPEFLEAWKKLAEEVIDVNIPPIPFSMLSPANADNGSIEAIEFAALGDLVTDLTEMAVSETIN